MEDLLSNRDARNEPGFDTTRPFSKDDYPTDSLNPFAPRVPEEEHGGGLGPVGRMERNKAAEAAGMLGKIMRSAPQEAQTDIGASGASENELTEEQRAAVDMLTNRALNSNPFDRMKPQDTGTVSGKIRDLITYGVPKAISAYLTPAKIAGGGLMTMLSDIWEGAIIADEEVIAWLDKLTKTEDISEEERMAAQKIIDKNAG